MIYSFIYYILFCRPRSYTDLDQLNDRYLIFLCLSYYLLNFWKASKKSYVYVINRAI